VGSDAADRTLFCTHHIAHAFVVPTLRKVREEWGTHRVAGASEIKAGAAARP